MGIRIAFISPSEMLVDNLSSDITNLRGFLFEIHYLNQFKALKTSRV
jgi:hypothetical protein